MYALVQAMKHWCHYLLGKETIIHSDHKPLQYLQTQSKRHNARHLKWVTYLQQFNIVIKYKKGVKNRIVDFLSRPPISTLSSFVQLDKFDFADFKELYKDDKDFSYIYSAMQQPLVLQDEHFKDYHL
eukprot:Gb_39692 [translate_table: standard]